MQEFSTIEPSGLKMGRDMFLWRRHKKNCPSTSREDRRCGCPIWADGMADGRRYRRALHTSDWAAARKYLARLERGEVALVKPLHDAVEAWSASLHVEPSTKAKYLRAARQLETWCAGQGIKAVSELTVELFDGFIARTSEKTRKRLARNTTIRELQSLRQFVSFCQDRAWIMGNPARKIRTPRTGKESQKEPFTAAEIKAMLEACEQIGRSAYERARTRTLILLLRNTGLRIGDAMMLSKARVRDGQVMLYTHKSGHPVWLPIPMDLQAALEALPLPLDQQNRPVDSGYYFWNGTAKRNSTVYRGERLLSYAFKKAKLVGAHAHRFRHTLAVDLLSKGATFDEVAMILGNSPRIVEKYYAPWSQSRQKRITDLMERVHGMSYGGYRSKADQVPSEPAKEKAAERVQ